VKRPSEHIEPLPHIPAPSARAWQYFRVRHLPVLTSGVGVVAVICLWAVNLPEPAGSGASWNASPPVSEAANKGMHVVELPHTNATVAAVQYGQANGNRAGSERLADND
jgi:hypothetical protein